MIDDNTNGDKWPGRILYEVVCLGRSKKSPDSGHQNWCIDAFFVGGGGGIFFFFANPVKKVIHV